MPEPDRPEISYCGVPAEKTWCTIINYSDHRFHSVQTGDNVLTKYIKVWTCRSTRRKLHISSSKTIMVIDGHLELSLIRDGGDEVLINLEEGQAYFIPPGCPHSYSATDRAVALIETTINYKESDTVYLEN